MKPSRAIPGQPPASASAAAALCLTFAAWLVAELPARFVAGAHFIISLGLALGAGACVVRLWRALQRESLLRSQAEDRLRAIELPCASGDGTQIPPRINGGRHGAAPGILSTREREVLCLIAGGLTNPQIALELHISLNTVERHVANVYRKLNVRGRVDATAYAVREGLAGARR